MVDTPPKNSEEQPSQRSNQRSNRQKDVECERQSIRSSIIAQRKKLSEQQLEQAELHLLTQLLPFLQDNNVIAGYNALNGEISVASALAHARNHGAKTLLPVMRDKALVFAPFNDSTSFTKRQFGIFEPDVPTSVWHTAEEIDLVLVPLVAFDANCNRLGMGGGFYDRSFAIRRDRKPPPLMVGVAHAMQQVQNVHEQWWDVPLDAIVTDRNVFHRT